MTGAEDLDALAMGRLTRVLGRVEAQRVYDATVKELAMERIVSADDLYAFAKILARSAGFAGAVGGLLSVAAVMRGATPKPE